VFPWVGACCRACGFGEDSSTHTRIRLEPDSHDPRFQPIILEPNAGAELAVIGEFVAAIG
jgi:hypothetical protein